MADLRKLVQAYTLFHRQHNRLDIVRISCLLMCRDNSHLYLFFVDVVVVVERRKNEQ